ncbi:MAG: RHS repeat-associated core domain-containing protein, partial [Desulfocapsaceae bacterium]|nr:RHS repeat-associated core domain-containing protein [Desulfocapsaceae bacterium]
YDAKGQRIREDVRDPEGILTYTIGLAYDANGNLVSRTWADNARETSAYDAVRNLVQSIDSTGMQTDSSYDALRRLLGVAEAGTAIAVYTYDRRDNPASVTDARGHVTRFTYDDLGNRLSVESPDAGITRMSYDPAGNLLRAVDAMGHTVSSQYDALNRPIKQSFFNAGDILFTYDQGANAIGKLSKITDQDGSNTFTYDAAGRIATETRIISGMSHTVGYSWDAATGELAGITYPSGLALTYSRDANGRISAIAADGTSIVSAVSRLPFGPVKAARLASTNLTRTYDQRYSVSAIKAGGADFGFSRDAGGNVTGITGVQAPTLTAETIDYSYNAANNQITAAPPKNYTYDANGNMASDGTLGFMYDGLNRLIQVSQGTSPIASYGYDANNRRIRKSTGGVTSHYLYDINNNLIAETLLDGTPLREYIYLDGEPIAVKEYQSIPGIYYFINDHLGTPQQLVDASGTVVWQAAYLPFGQAQVTTVTARNNLRFPGQYFDAETGLHYNLNRYYDSDTGRYISGDPIGLVGGMNLYAYVEGNPVNWFDPSGLFQFGIRSLNGFRPQIPLPNNVSTWHENGFYDNGSNSGYFPTGIGPDLSHDKNAYSMFGPYYDDSIIAKAEQSLRESNKWSPGDYSLKSHNCQDYADALRDKYKKLGGHTCSQPFTTGGWAGCFAIPGN